MVGSFSLKTRVYDKLKKMIIQGELEPNSRIDERELGKILGISRTPIREAVTELAQEGWITIIPRRGIFVSSINVSEINDIYQIRQSFEPIILELAYENLQDSDLIEFKKYFTEFLNKKLDKDDEIKLDILDNDFHIYILMKSGNNYLIKMMENIYNHNIRIRKLTPQSMSRRYAAIKEHIDLIQLLLDKQLKRAEKVLKKHAEKSKIGFYNK
ncbi:GntR family transcriptional regulator [Fusobacterium sp. PH5-44]|uniref:GntR family transcriptional regulator n=1 Tax=unclassified Fusobacterium TaxID=2648384 RepID=UPI003D21D30F